jgi:quinol monooxygenase YgiN
MEFVLLSRLTAKPGRRDRVVEILLESGKLFDDNSHVVCISFAKSADDPDLIWVADLWTSEEEHAEALEAPEMRPFVEECMPLLEGTPEQIRVLPVGRKVPGG